MPEPQFSILLLAARLGLAAVFLYSGIDKAWRYQAALAEFREARFSYPAPWVISTVMLHIAASLCLIAGRLVTEASLALALFTLLATIRVHRFWRLDGEPRLEVSRIAAANLAVVGGLLALAAAGPGRFVIQAG